MCVSRVQDCYTVTNGTGTARDGRCIQNRDAFDESSCGIGQIGTEFTSVYAAAKFAVEDWMEALHHDIKPYGIRTTFEEPGYFRTELLVDASTTWPEPAIDD